ncbi:hypothetical protein [Variovorax saccharolyticus]|uniref:hypothetical protein n=1 Tax=Variovorax saccharolyticus TaxID=3053516 RepID=UPI0025749874|nr:hypothetical protein [Variovorax sp. J22R187]MDM0019206.1 hypothetical protein [Variovorax sp. J22R187]
MLANRSMPAAEVIPVLAYADAPAAASWLCSAFGFTVRLRIGDHRIQLNVGVGAVVVRSADTGGAAPSEVQSVMVRVHDVDAHRSRAVASGAGSAGSP